MLDLTESMVIRMQMTNNPRTVGTEDRPTMQDRGIADRAINNRLGITESRHTVSTVIAKDVIPKRGTYVMKYFPFTGGNPLATNGFGEGKFRYEPSIQLLAERNKPSGMQCFWTAFLNQLKSLGLVAPDITRLEFEEQYTNVHGSAKTIKIIGRSSEVGFPGWIITDPQTAARVFKSIAEAFSKKGDWAIMTGMANKHFLFEPLMFPTKSGRRKINIEEVKRRLRAGETVHLGYPGHYMTGIGVNDAKHTFLVDDPIDNPHDPLFSAMAALMAGLRDLKTPFERFTWAIAGWPK
jgi:hypothetical protein